VRRTDDRSESDPSETTDLLAKYPERVQKLTGELQALLDTSPQSETRPAH
jgi:hypothetical protein